MTQCNAGGMMMQAGGGLFHFKPTVQFFALVGRTSR